MRIVGFNLSKILVERKEHFGTKPKVNQNIDIKNIIKEKIPISDQDALKINFNLSINYSENFAKLEFEGSVIGIPNKEELKKFLDTWKKKQIPEDARVPLFNFIMNKCNVKAIQLEDEMGLPLHVPMPRLSPKKEN
ncbi:hypothetical protein GF386_01435 [Candidatus Pacearchaeota archaeon]|nr:hypothetical protein [Candidatus Pacearchaeota archaeon]MBD3282845.1 hypothetical protein [Candidatus Pacearchaeota archaeon]